MVHRHVQVKALAAAGGDRDSFTERAEAFPRGQGDIHAFRQPGARAGVQIEHHPDPDAAPRTDWSRSGPRAVRSATAAHAAPAQRPAPTTPTRPGNRRPGRTSGPSHAGSAPGSTTPVYPPPSPSPAPRGRGGARCVELHLAEPLLDCLARDV